MIFAKFIAFAKFYWNIVKNIVQLVQKKLMSDKCRSVSAVNVPLIVCVCNDTTLTLMLLLMNHFMYTSTSCQHSSNILEHTIEIKNSLSFVSSNKARPHIRLRVAHWHTGFDSVNDYEVSCWNYRVLLINHKNIVHTQISSKEADFR